MNEFDQIAQAQQERNDDFFNSFDPEKFAHILRKSWMWLVLFFVISLSISYLYVRYTKPVYESESILKLDFESEAKTLGLANMESINFSELSGEIEILKSRLFFSRVAEVVDLNVSYYYYGRYLIDERYGNNPFVVSFKIKNSAFYDKPLDLSINGENTFTLNYEYGGQEYEKQFAFGEDIVTENFNFRIDKTRYFEFPQVEGKYFFVVNSQNALIKYFEDNVQVRPENFNAKTIRISLTDFNKFKAQDLVTAIDTIYLKYTKQAKNKALEQKILFLDDQIRETEQKLEEFENYFENFTIDNRTTDLQNDLRNTIVQLNALDSMRYNLRIKLGDLEVLQRQLESNEPLILNAVLIERLPDEMLESLKEYQDIYNERRIKLGSYSDNTYVIQQLDKELNLAKKDIETVVEDFEKEITDRISRVEAQRAFLESSFVELPSMGTEYNKNRRFYNLQEDFLLSLRQSKMELEITRAGTVTNFVVLSPASLPSAPIKPRPAMIYGVGFVVGLMVSLVFILIRYLIHNKITSVNELERLINVPVLGTVPKYTAEKLTLTRLVIKPSSKSALSESLRNIRTNMEFLNGTNDTRLITVTSTISGEGKTFVAVNLAAIIAFSNQKVCLVDLDMRKPKVHLAFGDEPHNKGVSTLLIGKTSLDECIVKSPIENLDFIPAGPNPPNPSELILNQQYDNILEELKERYDLIILDTPPVGLVTDAVLSMKKSDLQLYVIRSDYSKRSFVKSLENLKKINRFNNLTVIFNSVKSKGRSSGYGYGYGYGQGYGYYEE